MKSFTYAMLFALTGAFASGCATQKVVDAPNTTLGSVVVYKNGVAYFERYAAPHEKELSLNVPGGRVDDFLKSLSIVDEATGEALPVSYPTVASIDGEVKMTIALPAQHGRLRITYVTETPAWKPTYRVVLEDEAARLHGWAIVDNVSGEDWEHVRLGVGSTAALSFRYDLRSVRLVERELLSSGYYAANAPPSGGSPYTVARKSVRVLANLKDEELAGSVVTVDEVAITGQLAPAEADAGGSFWGDDDDVDGAPAADPVARDSRYRNRGLDDLNLAGGNHQIIVEGFAQAGDGDRLEASRRRAELTRERLIEMGVEEERIRIVANGELNHQQAVRLLASEAGEEAHIDESQAGSSEPVGHAHFVSDEPLSLEADHSAMVSIVDSQVKAERVFFYDPISERGNGEMAFNAVRLVNPTEHTLDGGPFTVYDRGQFIGEGLSDDIAPHSVTFVPYALDRSVLIDTEGGSREELDELITLERGIATASSRRIRKTSLTLTNRGQKDARVFVRHRVAEGFELMRGEQTKPVEELGGHPLFEVQVPKGEAVTLVIEEQTPLRQTVDIRTDDGAKAMGLLLRKQTMDPALAARLKDVLEMQKQRADLQDKIALSEEQMAVYRTRIDEVTFQLHTLKKVAQAEKLRRHLQEKLEELSETLQAATLSLTDMKGTLMTLEIQLQDGLAELRLVPAEGDEVDPTRVSVSP